MNYSIYPIHDSDFHQINKKINLSPNSKCIETQGYNYNDKCILQVNNGYHKPLNELCMEKHYKTYYWEYDIKTEKILWSDNACHLLNIKPQELTFK